MSENETPDQPTIDLKKARWSRRSRKLEAARQRMPKHGRKLAEHYRNAMTKRTKKSPES